MQRVTGAQKDRICGSAYAKMLAAREAHRALTLANADNRKSPGTHSEEKVQELVAAARAADAAVNSEVGGWTPDGIKLLLAYAQNAAILGSIEPDAQNPGTDRLNVGKACHLAKALMSVPDRYKPEAEKRRRTTEAFAALYGHIGRVPRTENGNVVTDGNVRFGLSEFRKKVAEVRANGGLMQATQLDEQYREIVRSFPKSWLEERQETTPATSSQPTTAAASIGEQLKTTTEEVVAAVAAPTRKGARRAQPR